MKAKIFISGYISILSAAIIMAAASCQKVENMNAGYPFSRLEITAEVPSFDIETKSESNDPADTLFAYPYDNYFTMPFEPVSYDSKAKGTYYYTIPDNTDKILFTTISEHNENYSVSHNIPDTLITVTCSKEGKAVGSDILIGHLGNYKKGSGKETIELKRATSLLNIVLKVSIGNDTVTNLTTIFDTVSLSIDNIAGRLALTSYAPDLMSYSGSTTIGAIFDNNETGCTIANLVTFPSNEMLPDITLKTLSKNGTAESYRKELPKRIEKNKCYTITLYLHKENNDMAFKLSDVTITDIVRNETDTEQGSFDMLSFSKNSIFLKQEANDTDYVTITSRLGYWNATIDKETLDNFKIFNKSTGMEACADSVPTLRGSSGDTLAVTSLNDNDGTGNISKEIIVDAGTKENRKITILQSNGQTQTITFSTNHQFSISGYDIQVFKQEKENWNLLKDFRGILIDNEIFNDYNYYDKPLYKIEGQHITDFRIMGYHDAGWYSGETYSVEFDNCTSLQNLELFFYENYINSMDLGNFTNLEYLTIYIYDYNTQLASLDISENINLKGICLGNINNVNIRGISASDSTRYPKLETIIFEGIPTTANFSHCPLLKEAIINDADTINLSHCPLLAEFNLNDRYNKLTAVDLSYCTSLANLSWADDDRFEKLASVNLENCTNLSEFKLPYYDYNHFALSNINVRNCTNLKSFILSKRFNNYFPAVKSLDFTGCRNLDTLKLYVGSIWDSKSVLSIINIDESNIGIFQLNNMPVLDTINLNNCSINTVDMNFCPSLKRFDSNNLEIKNVNISSCALLDEVFCDGSAMENITLSKNEKCKVLSVNNCTELKTIDITECNALYKLSLDGTDNITYFKLWKSDPNSVGPPTMPAIENCTKLEELYLKCSNKSSLDLKAMTNLDTIEIRDCNKLNLLDCSDLANLKYLNNTPSADTVNLNGCAALDSLWLSGERLKIIDLNGLQSLKYIKAMDMTSISALNFDVAPVLNRIHIENAGIQSLILPSPNNLESIYISKCDKLEADCVTLNAKNTLAKIEICNETGWYAESKNLDFSNYTALTDIHLVENWKGFTGCNLSGCTKLMNAYFTTSFLKSLDITDCCSLMKLDMYDCRFEADMLNNIFNMLPDRTGKERGLYRITSNPGTEACDQSIPDEKNWIPVTDKP